MPPSSQSSKASARSGQRRASLLSDSSPQLKIAVVAVVLLGILSLNTSSDATQMHHRLSFAAAKKCASPIAEGCTTAACVQHCGNAVDQLAASHEEQQRHAEAALDVLEQMQSMHDAEQSTVSAELLRAAEAESEAALAQERVAAAEYKQARVLKQQLEAEAAKEIATKEIAQAVAAKADLEQAELQGSAEEILKASRKFNQEQDEAVQAARSADKALKEADASQSWEAPKMQWRWIQWRSWLAARSTEELAAFGLISLGLATAVSLLRS